MLSYMKGVTLPQDFPLVGMHCVLPGDIPFIPWGILGYLSRNVGALAEMAT